MAQSDDDARSLAAVRRDRNHTFQEYNCQRPTKNVQALLDHIAKSGDPVFWGL